MSQPLVTLLLKRMADGDSAAEEELFALVQSELRARAGRLMGGEAGGHTLQPTAVVNEAWLRLSGGAAKDWSSRAHFLGVATKAMRSVLVDHARAKRADKRGGDAERVPLDEAVRVYEERAVDLVALDDALDRFAEVDPQLARLVELRFFGGLTLDETARMLGVSTPTVERGWRTARSWLRTVLGGEAEAG